MTLNVISIATRGPWTVRADARQIAEALGTLTDSAGHTVGCLVDDVSLGELEFAPLSGTSWVKGFACPYRNLSSLPPLP
jgi:hypothetical protein